MFKNFFSVSRNKGLIFLPAILLFALSVHSQHPVDKLQLESKGRLSEEGVSFLKKNYIPRTTPCDKISDVGGWWWQCKYRDGFVVFNCFRKCRGTMDTGRYFLGLSEGDCDSYALVRGKRAEMCFPRDAEVNYRSHGPVIAIQRLNECRE